MNVTVNILRDGFLNKYFKLPIIMAAFLVGFLFNIQQDLCFAGPTPPPTVTLTADKYDIHAGEAVTLSWTSTDAESVNIDSSNPFDPWHFGLPLNGSTTFYPTVTTTYTATAANSKGSATDSVTINVIPAPIINFSASQYVIFEGQTTTLNWSTANADSAEIDNGIGLVSLSGSLDVTPSSTTTYNLTATGASGVSTGSVTVSVVSSTPASSVSKVYRTLVNSNLYGRKQLVRSSSGKPYYFAYNGGHTNLWDGWIDVYSSDDSGRTWSRVGGHDEMYWYTGMGVAIDSQDVVHVVTYDWNLQPYYEKFNTIDSLNGVHSWEGHELLDTQSISESVKTEIAIDEFDNPHIIYQLIESSKGSTYNTLYYTNKIAGSWNKMAILSLGVPPEGVTNTHVFDIAIGPDNIPYILTDGRIFKGDANNPTFFEEVNLGSGVNNLSFVIHQNGDVRVGATISNGNYVNYVHNALDLWSSGWTMYDSGRPGEGILVLANDIPHTVWHTPDQIWVREDFGDPVLLATIPENHDAFETFITSRWSFYNFHSPSIIDTGARSWQNNYYPAGPNDGTHYWHIGYFTETTADFSASPQKGLAPLTVNFLDYSGAQSDAQIVGWEWDFDNDGVVDSIEQNPTYTFNQVGTYTVSLVVTDSKGSTATLTKNNYIIADEDADSDNVFDLEDNCPGLYNQTQVDLDADGIGYACDPHVDLLEQAALISGLRKETTDDSDPQNITSTLQDGLSSGQDGVPINRNIDVISLQANIDSTLLSTAEISLYVDSLDGSSQSVRVYAYNSDNVSVNTTNPIDATLVQGWNTIDVSSLLPSVEGFGIMKFRIVAVDSWVEISEAGLTGSSVQGVDDYEFSVDPLSADLGSVEVEGYSWATFTVTNTGEYGLVVESVTISQSFSIVQDECSGHIFSDIFGLTCQITIGFSPQDETPYNGILTINSNDHDNPQLNINLQATGIAANYATIQGTVSDEITFQPIENTNIEIAVARETNTGPADKEFGPEDWTTADYDAVLENDEIKAVSEIQRYSPGEHIFNVRNPINTTDSIKITWNGCGGDTGDKLLAQSFTAGMTGQLTSVRLYMSRDSWDYSQIYGNVQVILKSGVGGEEDSILSESTLVAVRTLPTDDAFAWIDFQFPTPVDIVSGQKYYLELASTAYKTAGYSASLFDVYWGVKSGTPYNSGEGFRRTDCIWQPFEGSHSFETFVDGISDQSQTTQIDGYSTAVGLVDRYHGLQIYNRTNNTWDTLVSKKHGLGYDDETFEAFIEDNLSDYYDPNGWVRFRAYVSSNTTYPWMVVATDFLKVAFINTYQTVSLADGIYSFENLPAGDFDISYDAVFYYDKFLTGSIGSGEAQTLDAQLTPAPALEIAITGPSNGASISSSSVTVSGTVTNNPTVTVNGTNASVFNGIFSTSINLNVGPNTITATALDEFGQTKSTSITVDGTLAQLSGTITDSSGNPLQSAKVSIRDASYTGWRDTYTAADGTYTFTGVPGAYIGNISLAGYGSHPFNGVLTSGEIQTYDAALLKQLPQISDIIVSNITDTSALITWTTDQPATSQVDYGLTTSYGSTASDPTLVTSHSITLTGLTAGTTYHYMISSANSDGVLQITPDRTFTTIGPPLISTIAVSQITGNSATISWTTDQPATSQLDYGKTSTYDQVVLDTALTTNHSVDLTNLISGATYHFMVTSENDLNLSSSSVDNTFVTQQVMALTITSPTEGEIVPNPYVLVHGTITGTAAEYGITANNVIGLVDNGQFAVNHIPLTEGANTIIVTATDSDGNIAEALVNVTYQPALESVKLLPDIESGLAPLTVNFQIDTSVDLTTGTASMNYVGPDTADSVTFTSIDEFTVQVSTPGIYTITAEVTDASSNVYTDSYAILAIDRTVLDTLLQSKWNGMKSAMIAGDINAAVQGFTLDQQQVFSEIFTLAQDNLPQIASEMQPIELIYQKNNTTEYRIKRDIVFEGVAETVTFYIYFQREADGIWRIRDF